MPNYAKKELLKLEEVMAPFMKRASKYRMWSLPLVAISFINLIILLFVMPEKHIPMILVYGVIGAFGLALSKEAKYQQKEMLKRSADYITNRIMKSDMVSVSFKKRYVSLVKEQPFLMMNHFTSFLEKEEEEKEHDMDEPYSSTNK
ncbi:hypothetical protein DX933_12725 [Ornithinibacillus gellani]|uniref:DUF5392 family protein n=1 Tax=Ornithinibacillus gellani TaxID=2293253 RepID=UPI000F4A6423|nr:DUF5392 family protein [Ornithinibacillus gellani]TQS74185.1 hypothetical protein DX933_12725 [Ornithinibacillus gellani]